MIDSQTTLFRTVLSCVLESFATDIRDVLVKFHENLEEEDRCDPKLVLEDIFCVFPRENPKYKTMIEVLVKLADCSPGRILKDQAKSLKGLVKTGQGILMSIIKGLVSLQALGEYEHTLLFYFGLVFQADLICQITVNYAASEAIVALLSCGFRLCTFVPVLPRVFAKVVDQWAVIFSVVSESALAEVVRGFDAFGERNALLLSLIKYLRLDLNPELASYLMSDVAQMLRISLRKRSLTKEIMSAMARLMITAPVDCEEQIMLLFEIAWAVKEDKELREGAFEVIVVGFLKLDSVRAKMPRFFDEDVFSNTEKKTHVKHCLVLFQWWIFGTKVDPKWLFWEYGVEPRVDPLCRLAWNSQVGKASGDSDSFMSMFIRNFFGCSDFNVCPEAFCNVLVVLAGSDFVFFTDNVVPKFLDLDNDDPRLLVLLMTVPLINVAAFKQYATSNVSDEQIIKFNGIVRPFVMNAVKRIVPDPEHGVCVPEIDANLETLISESDQKVASTVEKLKIVGISETKVCYMKPGKDHDGPSLEVELVKCVPVVLLKEERESEEMMNLMLQLAVSANRQVAIHAFANCVGMSANKEFIAVVLRCLSSTPSAEVLHVYIHLLREAVKAPPKTFDEEMLHDMELITLIGLTSFHPSIRHNARQLGMRVNELLNNQGCAGFIGPEIPAMEEALKHRMIREDNLLKPQMHVVSSANSLKYVTVLYSHYFYIWQMFLCEVANRIVMINYEPLISRIRNNLQGYELSTDANVGLLIFTSAVSGCVSSLVKTTELSATRIFTPHPETTDDRRYLVVDLVKCMMELKDFDRVFAFVMHVHITLYSEIIPLLTLVPVDRINGAAYVLRYILRNPAISEEYMRELVPVVSSLLGILQNYFTSQGANGPRVIDWTPESESIVRDMASLVTEYCVIVIQCFGRISVELTEDECGFASREIVFRFLANWAVLESPDLQSVRRYARRALGVIVRIGQIFTDAVLFDQSAVRLFASVESEGIGLLGLLLRFHIELLLERYVEACYLEPRSSGDQFFEAIFVVFQSENSQVLQRLAGQLAFLGMVYERSGYPRAEAYLSALLGLINPNVSRDKGITSIMRDSTEAVIEAALGVLRYQCAHVQKKDVYEVLKQWIQNVRLLPNQWSCVPGIRMTFHVYTPYEFLVALMKTTETVGDEHFSSMASLWAELMQPQDHQELIPLFLSEWSNNDTKRKMFWHLVLCNAPGIVRRLASHCSFSYYYHTTVSLEKPWRDELWIIPVITEAYRKASDELSYYIPTIVNFAFVCCVQGEFSLLEALARQFSIDLPNDLGRIEDLVGVINVFVDRMEEDSEAELYSWGLEALRWLFGCRHLRIAIVSLTIYNRIKRPTEHLVVTGVCKAVAYHVAHSQDDTKLLGDLVCQALRFYVDMFNGNQSYALSFAVCFLDCKVFFDSCLLSATPLFVKALSCRTTFQDAWSQCIGFIRPLLSRLETDVRSRKIIELLLTNSQSQELKMIVAPLKESHPDLFTTFPPFEELMQTASETIMCKSLVHYSLMLVTASPQLLDAIFWFSAQIVQRVVNENNRNPLAKIYKVALMNLLSCPGATEFIKVVAGSEAGVATKSVFEFYDWDRSLEDVSRSLEQLVIEESGMVMLTDCSTLESVYNLLGCEVAPKILPFAAQREMLEGMMGVTCEANEKPKHAMGMGIPRDTGTVRSFRNLVLNFGSHDWNISRISSPEKLLTGSDMFKVTRDCKLVMTPQQLLSVTSRDVHDSASTGSVCGASGGST